MTATGSETLSPSESVNVIVAVPGPKPEIVNVADGPEADAGETVATPVFELLAVMLPAAVVVTVSEPVPLSWT